MPLRARISHHLDLYRYWLAKRGFRPMPARTDINPADISALLPYLGLVNKVDDQFRHRLVGTAAVREIGRDLTGSVVGSYYSSTPESAAVVRATFERVFTTEHPIFARRSKDPAGWASEQEGGVSTPADTRIVGDVSQQYRRKVTPLACLHGTGNRGFQGGPVHAKTAVKMG